MLFQREDPAPMPRSNREAYRGCLIIAADKGATAHDVNSELPSLKIPRPRVEDPWEG